VPEDDDTRRAARLQLEGDRKERRSRSSRCRIVSWARNADSGWGVVRRSRRAYALTTNRGLHTLQEAFIMSATKHPFTRDGLIDWMSPEAQQALVFMKKLSTMKGVGPQLDFGGDPLWTAGFVDLYVGQDSRTGWIKKLLGPMRRPLPRCLSAAWAVARARCSGATASASCAALGTRRRRPTSSCGLSVPPIRLGRIWPP